MSRLIFNAAKVTGEVEATAQIMQSFTQYAPKAVADYSSAKAAELRKQGKEEEAKKWDEGGAYRVAAHTIVGGLAGDIAGALGAGTSAATIPAVGDMINSTDLPSEVKQTLVALAGTAIGAAAGATTGDGGALSGGATGYAQTVNNYLSEGQKDQRTKQLGSCQRNSDCVKAVNDYWNKIDNKTTMIGKIASDAWSGFAGGYEALQYLSNLDPNEHPEISPFIVMLKTKGYDSNMALKGVYTPKVIDTAQYFNPLNIFNTVNTLQNISDFKITNPYTIGGHPGLYNQEKQ